MSLLKVLTCSKHCARHTTILTKLYHKLRPYNEYVNEVEIEVPWGKITGKLWGKPERQPILALHGWQDNAASFDRLSPLLLDNASILAIDLPGHGTSSWLPPGEVYLDFTYLMTIHRIKKYFNWKKVKILAHSMSAQISFIYAATFPEDVEFIVALDALKAIEIDIQYQRNTVKNVCNKLLEMEQNYSTVPKYTKEEIMNRWIKASFNSINEDACKLLMMRGTRKNEDGTYSLTRDARLKLETFIIGGTNEQIEEMAELITCPYLYLSAEDSNLKSIKQDENVIEIMKKSCKEFQTYTLPGTHHFHMIHGNEVARPINCFLQKYNKDTVIK